MNERISTLDVRKRRAQEQRNEYAKDLEEASKELCFARQKYHQVNALVLEESTKIREIDRERAEIDGRLREYHMNGSEKTKRASAPRCKKSKSATKDALALLRGMDEATLEEFLSALKGKEGDAT
jgi:chromosome segregation ATPase